MCGIAGISGEIRKGDRTRLEAMVHALRRRGPDGVGHERWNRALLGHRRLAIFDLSDRGAQPMVSPDGSIGVVFNGAIYNFPALRIELERKGFRFESDSDTEVLVHGYRAWGIGPLVDRLRGMFAIGIWDDRRDLLWLARDRLGIKPLVYASEGTRFAFASTVDALRAGGFGGALDPEAVEYFLTYGFVPEDRPIVRGLRKLPPATILRLSRGDVQLSSYWTPSASVPAAASFEEAKERFWHHFMTALELRLKADVPVAALLSGGIDSSLVCRGIVETGANLEALTVATPGAPGDEAAAASRTARSLGIEHRVIRIEEQEVGILDELTDAYSEPFAAGSALGMLAVAKAARNSAKVLITGDGGDDCFLGYPRHRVLFWTQRLAQLLPRTLAGAWSRWRPNLPRPLDRLVRPIDFAAGGLPAFLQAKPGIDGLLPEGVVRGDLLASSRIEERGWEWSVDRGRRVLEEYLEYDRSHQFVSEYLTKVDGSTMHHGIEARSPFLDHVLWEFAYALPPSTRLHRQRLKAILRSVAEDKIDPDTARRKKQGFVIPVQDWLVSRWRDRAEVSFGPDSMLVDQRILDPRSLRRAWLRSLKNETVPLQLWHAFVLEQWLRRKANLGGAQEPETRSSVAIANQKPH